MRKLSRRTFSAGLGAGLLGLPLISSRPAGAQNLEKLRVAKSVSTSLAFAGLQVGAAAEIWQKVGLDVQLSAFSGDARMQQAMTSGDIDIGLGSGPGMGYAAKGVPAMAVAALAGKPQNMCIVVSKDSKFKNVSELRGQKVGVTTAGSLTYWLVRELSRQQGWGIDGMQPVPMGEMRTRLAAMQSGELPASVTATVQAFEFEEDGIARVLLVFGEMVPDFHTHIIFAHNKVRENNPEAIRKFLQGWFETVRFMKKNKDFTVKVAAKELRIKDHIVARLYDAEMEMLSDDGQFDPKALEVIGNSFTELGILESKPDMKTLYDHRFVPVKL